ncbi:MAG TPA: glycosyltransferase [Pyrinomonadaceae bacterium]
MKPIQAYDESPSGGLPGGAPPESNGLALPPPASAAPPEEAHGALPEAWPECAAGSRAAADSVESRPRMHQAQVLTELRARVKAQAEALRWITLSRSWRYTSWLRRLNFLLLRLRTRLGSLQPASFHGALEQPAEVDEISQEIEIRGWAYSEGAAVVRVEAFLDTISLGPLCYGKTRLDVAPYPSRAPVKCGYEGRLTVDESLFVGRRRLTVRVTDQRGRIEDYEQMVEVPGPAERPAGPGAEPAPGDGTWARTDAFSLLAQDSLSFSKKTLESMCKFSLGIFFSSDSVIEFPQHETPATSIILVLYNRAELTLKCLQSILNNHKDPYEVVIIDNASTDETPALLGRVRGARVVRNETNVHYLRACNQAARLARGRNLLLLNNDAQLLNDAVAAATETLDSSDDIGAVGGRIILPDVTLQEAGSIVWQDGSCHGYGRGGAPNAPEFLFRRDVDYCSAVFLLTRRELFLEGGGFDEAFAPAYYEDADYCVRLWKRGKRVVYDPRVSVLHYEFGSAVSFRRALEMQSRHQPVFAAQHREWLSAQQPFSPSNVLAARTHALPRCRRVLYLDDRVPHAHLGSGFPRSNRIVSEMVAMGHCVTCYPLDQPHEEWAEVYGDIPREVEVMLGRGRAGLEEFLAERAGYYDLVYVSRPHNMAALKALLERHPQLLAGAKVVYDAEALFSLREAERLRLRGRAPSEREKEGQVSEEVGLAVGCDAVVSVSDGEGREFARRGFSNVHTLGHTVNARPTPRGFDERRDILFVGAIHDPDSPNADSVAWFGKSVLPLIQKSLGEDVRLLVAGHASRDFFAGLDNGHVKVLGRVEDLTELYDRARLFVAPTRFSAGLPYKVHEAAAYGLPVVATTLIGGQLGWAHEEEVLLADDAKGFASACIRLYRDERLWTLLRENALKRVEMDCSPVSFSERLTKILR